MLFSLCVVLGLWLAPSGLNPNPAPLEPPAGLAAIRLPQGFAIEYYAREVKGARSLSLGPHGMVFVGSRRVGSVSALTADPTHSTVPIAQGLEQPNGVAFHNGALYVAEPARILRFDGIEQSLHSPPQPAIITTNLPRGQGHEWKFIRFGPDGKLYIPQGMPCNTCEPSDERFGTILRCNPDGSGMEIFARGVRNTVGFDWDPVSRELWFTDNGRDWLGDDIPDDELNHAPRAGMHFGFPYCYGKGVPDPQYQGRDCSLFTPMALGLGAHVAALGMRFYTGTMFPARYRNGIFIAEHGSWNRSTPTGYRVVFVPVVKGRPGSAEVFAEGWLQGKEAWGRPVDVEVLPDGSLLVSDDKGDAVYRITYRREGGVR